MKHFIVISLLWSRLAGAPPSSVCLSHLHQLIIINGWWSSVHPVWTNWDAGAPVSLFLKEPNPSLPIAIHPHAPDQNLDQYKFTERNTIGLHSCCGLSWNLRTGTQKKSIENLTTRSNAVKMGRARPHGACGTHGHSHREALQGGRTGFRGRRQVGDRVSRG